MKTEFAEKIMDFFDNGYTIIIVNPDTKTGVVSEIVTEIVKEKDEYFYYTRDNKHISLSKTYLPNVSVCVPINFIKYEPIYVDLYAIEETLIINS